MGGIIDLKESPNTTLTLINPAGMPIDKITFDMPFGKGASAMLDGSCQNTADNDKKSCWKTAPTSCGYGLLVGQTGFDWSKADCKADKDCKAPQKCLKVKQDYEDGWLYKVDPVLGSDKCAIRDRGTPGVSNICK